MTTTLHELVTEEQLPLDAFKQYVICKFLKT